MKKLLALILALVLTLAPISAFAEEPCTYTVYVYRGTVSNDPAPAYTLTVEGEEGMTGTEVLREALEDAEIPHVIEATEYGNYLASLDGLSELDHGKLSGWLCAINDDRFSNMGLDTVLEAESELEVHYSVTGGEDIGATWGSLSILTELTLNDTTVTMTKETDYTTYTTTYLLNGRPMEGDGSEEDPFVIPVTLPYGTDLSDVSLSWKSSLHPCYAELDGETSDFSAPVSLALYCSTGGETYYLVTASVKAPSYGGGGGGGSISREPEKNPLDLEEYLADLSVSGFGSEWSVIALSRGGADLPQSEWDGYFRSVIDAVQKTNGVLSTRKYTEYSRTVLALKALGADPKNVAGFDLTAPLSDKEAVLKQGINGAIWARLALGDGYLEEILAAQNEDGGWSLSGDSSDVDLTAMALTAIADSGEKAAINAGVKFLDGITPTTCETAAQILIARAALGLSTDTEALLSFRTKDGFSHEKDGETNRMATEQAVLALVATTLDDGSLYDMSGVSRKVSVFYDVTAHPNKTAIEALANHGLLTGFPNGAFSPDAPMTRAEFCALITRALGLTGGECHLSDVKPTDWYYGAVCAATASGIVKGRTNGMFDPSAHITVFEANLMVSRAAEYLGVSWQGEDGTRDILRCEIAQMVYDLLEMANA